MRVIWVLILWSLIEIGLYVSVGSWLGVLGTWSVVLGSAGAGLLIIRWKKRTVLGQVVQDLQSLGDALTPAAHSALIVLAGILLILPGFLTDLAGLLLLLPPVRVAIIQNLHRRAKSAVQMAAMDRAVDAMLHPRNAQVIDAEAEEVPPPQRPHKPSGWTKP